MKKSLLLLAGLCSLGASVSSLSAHCQVPCGIYADDNVFVTLETDVKTIQKAMAELANEKTATNQKVRWVNNKEAHAQSIQDVVAQYFLAQRVKIDGASNDKENYTQKLTLLHQITVYAMKCKQTTDMENAKKLSKAIADFKALYKKK